MSAASFGFGLFNFIIFPLCCYSFVAHYFLQCMSCCENRSTMFLLVVIILIKAEIKPLGLSVVRTRGFVFFGFVLILFLTQ